MTEFQKYIQRYLDLIPTENWVVELENSGNQTLELFNHFSEDEGNYFYAEGKWSLKSVLQHLIDAERIFVYRALRFSRNDQTELAGWDEEEFAKNYFPAHLNLSSLRDEFEYVRNSTLLFFKNLNPEVFARTGTANKNEISVETLGKLIIGHNLHHLNIVTERYLPGLKKLL